MNDDRQPSLYAAFATMLEASAAPYGYTITIWSSGAVLMHFRGMPAVVDVFAFLAGAVAGFTLLGALGRPFIKRAKPLPPGPPSVWAGAMDWLAVGLAVGAAALIAKIPSWVAWPAASLTATVVYLGAATLQLALATRVGH
jgi:hypothetical protein